MKDGKEKETNETIWCLELPYYFCKYNSNLC